MLLMSRFSSSSCTGSYAGEMALAAVQKTINDSHVLSRPMFVRSVQCFEFALVLKEFLQ